MVKIESNNYIDTMTDLMNKIYEVNGQLVMLDTDLAKLFGYETKRFNELVKNNKDKFEEGVVTKLTKEQFDNLRSKYFDFKIEEISHGGRRSIPSIFTKQAIEVLGIIVKNENAREITYSIIEAFSARKNDFEIVSKSTINTENIRNLIYTIRGEQVMLNIDLASIYNYDIKGFNRQVMNNIDKFESDFMFQLTTEEWEKLWRKFYATTLIKKSRTRPYAFTEAGIYMLMTVLKGELAVQQSKTLIRTFKEMRHYLMENRTLTDETSLIRLSLQVNELSNNVNSHDTKIGILSNEVQCMNTKMNEIMDNFIDDTKIKQWSFVEGEKFEADIAYRKIYEKAKNSIILLDNFLSYKTLQQMNEISFLIVINVISDYKPCKDCLEAYQLEDFKTKHPYTSLIQANGKVHDRYIILDYDTPNEQIYHCGTSSKDAGSKLCTIMKMDTTFKFHETIFELLLNEEGKIK